MPRNQPPVHPLGPVMLALLGVGVFGSLYGIFGIGKDALIFASSVSIVFAMPVVVIFGITGIVIGIRRLLRRRQRGN
jgi:hypothetical protein